MNIMEYKRRTAITESLRTEKTPREIITFFEYLKRSMMLRYVPSEEFEKDFPAKKKHAREKEQGLRNSFKEPKSLFWRI